MADLDDEARALLDGRNIAHVATLMPDGGPHSVAVWIRREGERLAFFTQESTQKARNLARDQRVAISIVDRENPYRSLRLRGRVAERVTGDAALEIIDRLSDDYTGQPFPMRQGVVFLISPEHAATMTLPFRD